MELPDDLVALPADSGGINGAPPLGGADVQEPSTDVLAALGPLPEVDIRRPVGQRIDDKMRSLDNPALAKVDARATAYDRLKKQSQRDAMDAMEQGLPHVGALAPASQNVLPDDLVALPDDLQALPEQIERFGHGDVRPQMGSVNDLITQRTGLPFPAEAGVLMSGDLPQARTRFQQDIRNTFSESENFPGQIADAAAGAWSAVNAPIKAWAEDTLRMTAGEMTPKQFAGLPQLDKALYVARKKYGPAADHPVSLFAADALAGMSPWLSMNPEAQAILGGESQERAALRGAKFYAEALEWMGYNPATAAEAGHDAMVAARSATTLVPQTIQAMTMGSLAEKLIPAFGVLPALARLGVGFLENQGQMMLFSAAGASGPEQVKEAVAQPWTGRAEIWTPFGIKEIPAVATPLLMTLLGFRLGRPTLEQAHADMSKVLAKNPDELAIRPSIGPEQQMRLERNLQRPVEAPGTVTEPAAILSPVEVEGLVNSIESALNDVLSMNEVPQAPHPSGLPRVRMGPESLEQQINRENRAQSDSRGLGVDQLGEEVERAEIRFIGQGDPQPMPVIPDRAGAKSAIEGAIAQLDELGNDMPEPMPTQWQKPVEEVQHTIYVPREREAMSMEEASATPSMNLIIMRNGKLTGVTVRVGKGESWFRTWDISTLDGVANFKKEMARAQKLKYERTPQEKRAESAPRSKVRGTQWTTEPLYISEKPEVMISSDAARYFADEHEAIPLQQLLDAPPGKEYETPAMMAEMKNRWSILDQTSLNEGETPRLKDIDSPEGRALAARRLQLQLANQGGDIIVIDRTPLGVITDATNANLRQGKPQGLSTEGPAHIQSFPAAEVFGLPPGLKTLKKSAFPAKTSGYFSLEHWEWVEFFRDGTVPERVKNGPDIDTLQQGTPLRGDPGEYGVVLGGGADLSARSWDRGERPPPPKGSDSGGGAPRGGDIVPPDEPLSGPRTNKGGMPEPSASKRELTGTPTFIPKPEVPRRVTEPLGNVLDKPAVSVPEPVRGEASSPKPTHFVIEKAGPGDVRTYGVLPNGKREYAQTYATVADAKADLKKAGVQIGEAKVRFKLDDAPAEPAPPVAGEPSMPGAGTNPGRPTVLGRAPKKPKPMLSLEGNLPKEAIALKKKGKKGGGAAKMSLIPGLEDVGEWMLDDEGSKLLDSHPTNAGRGVPPPRQPQAPVPLPVPPANLGQPGGPGGPPQIPGAPPPPPGINPNVVLPPGTQQNLRKLNWIEKLSRTHPTLAGAVMRVVPGSTLSGRLLTDHLNNLQGARAWNSEKRVTYARQLRRMTRQKYGSAYDIDEGSFMRGDLSAAEMQQKYPQLWHQVGKDMAELKQRLDDNHDALVNKHKMRGLDLDRQAQESYLARKYLAYVLEDGEYQKLVQRDTKLWNDTAAYFHGLNPNLTPYQIEDVMFNLLKAKDKDGWLRTSSPFASQFQRLKHRRELPKQIQEFLGVNRSGHLAVGESLAAQESLRMMYDAYAEIAKIPEFVQDVPPATPLNSGLERWQKLEGGRNKWGDLAGKYVHPFLRMQLEVVPRQMASIPSIWRRITAWSKFTHIVGGSPGAWVWNALYTLKGIMNAGLGPHRVVAGSNSVGAHFVRMARADWRKSRDPLNLTKDPFIEEINHALRVGADVPGFGGAELASAAREELALNLYKMHGKPNQTHLLDVLRTWSGYTKKGLSTTLSAAGHGFDWPERMVRLATWATLWRDQVKVLQKANPTMTAADIREQAMRWAANEVATAFPQLDRTAPAVRNVQRNAPSMAMPLAGITSETIRNEALYFKRLLVDRDPRVWSSTAAWALFGYAAYQFSRYMSDIPDAEIEKARKKRLMSEGEWAQWQVPLPGRINGQVTFMNLSPFSEALRYTQGPQSVPLWKRFVAGAITQPFAMGVLEGAAADAAATMDPRFRPSDQFKARIWEREGLLDMVKHAQAQWGLPLPMAPFRAYETGRQGGLWGSLPVGQKPQPAATTAMRMVGLPVLPEPSPYRAAQEKMGLLNDAVRQFRQAALSTQDRAEREARMKAVRDEAVRRALEIRGRR